MSMLRYYTTRAAETKGLQHQAVIANLRNYIKTTPIEQLLDAIAHINKLEQLKALWEAGLTADLQKTVLRRYEELTQRRGES